MDHKHWEQTESLSILSFHSSSFLNCQHINSSNNLNEQEYLHVLQDIIIPRKLRMSPTIDYFLKTADHGPTENQCTEPSTISHFTHQATCHLANDQLTGCRQRT